MSRQHGANGDEPLSAQNNNVVAGPGLVPVAASPQAAQQPAGAAGGSGANSSSSSMVYPIPMVTSSTTYQAWSRSYIELYTIQHEWTIDNFIELDEEATVVFRVAIEGNEELKFKLSLKPKYGENRDYISLYVHNLNKKELKYSLVFNLLNVDKERCLTRRADTRVHSTQESWGFPKFCQRAEVVDGPAAAAMLPDGTLTVLCEIGGFKRISNRSDYQRVRDQFDCDADGLNDLCADLATGFEEMEHADLTLVCQGEQFRCHKFMLASRSDVFKAMFQHDMRESQLGVVEIEDATPDVVRAFLKFIYTDTMETSAPETVDFRTVAQLLPLAEKYNVKRLCTMCGQCLLQSMNVANASEIAVLGHVYCVPLLKNRAIEFISQYPERVMHTPGWQILLKEAPDVCTAIICRLSRMGSEREVIVKSSTRSSS